MSGQGINLKNLTITRAEDNKVLSSASFAMASKETVAIYGPGGSGKSLLLSFLIGSKIEGLDYSFDSYKVDAIKLCHLDFNKNKNLKGTAFPDFTSDLYLIDEPENAFELEGFNDFISGIRNQDKMLIFVTHHLGYLEQVDKILVIRYGDFGGIYTNWEFFNSEDPYISHISRMGC